MGLEEFEKELTRSKARSHEHRDDDHDRDRSHRHHHRTHRHRHRHRDESRDEERRHRHKRRRKDDEDEQRHGKKHRSHSPRREEEVKVFDSDDDGEDEWVEKDTATAPPEENILDQRGEDLKSTKMQRDAWMEEPSALDIDYVQSKKPKAPSSQFVGAKDSHEFKVHEKEVDQHLAELERDVDSDGGDGVEKVKEEPAQHEVSYTFGDSGSSWRMTKLKAIYRQAEESGRSVDEIAMDRYGHLRDFDDAREEERELDRREMYGKEYVGLEKPSGELFQERKLNSGIRRNVTSGQQQPDLPQAHRMPEAQPPARTVPLDQNALNRLKAQLTKAKLRNAPNAAQLEEEYNAAEAASLAPRSTSDVVVLNSMENRMLAGDRSGEVTAVLGKRGRERGLVNENEDMSIEDMMKQEKRTRGMHGGEGRAFAERIAKDGKFANDLDYMDDNAEKLSKKVVKSDTNLRNAAIGDFQKMQRILENCPLCFHEETNQPPTAPVVSLATRTYLTLPTEPEIARGGAMIVPLQHRLNLLECDDDEWEEMRNFMKSLTRFYHGQDKSVIFYENAAFMGSRKGHAALNAIPLPHHLAENAPAYFKEAILASDEQWSQHKQIIDTLALVQKPGYGKAAFRKAMVKEMPYFHVFFTLDGGMGHVVEDERRWPKGDLFAREVIGGMLDKGPEVIKKQGRWDRDDRRLESFRKKWDKFDWTKILMDAQ
ncbi:Pre-mRNA-splicing factor cwf19 [Lecanosticta acicola]|uniref:Pre-mRNA-splicing factor cwf19 n=1 Tax=Lecanosticta acicola TaxID=111012 RepID=A0AAI8Z410_9PEZI|nr:Pre-mRNA-splicing factor cwf19 [Lecanosticta acicola]